jgi:hypothetical protein
VLFKSIFLIQQVYIRVSELRVLVLLGIEILSHSIDLVIFILHSKLEVSNLGVDVRVSCSLVIDFFS